MSLASCNHGVGWGAECVKCDRVWRDLRFSTEHLVLANFYSVDSMPALVDAQYSHIKKLQEKLQEKLPLHKRDDQPRRLREG